MKKKEVQAASKKGGKPKLPEPASERIDDKRFIEMFWLIQRAVEHEMGTGIMKCETVSGMELTTSPASKASNRLSILSIICGKGKKIKDRQRGNFSVDGYFSKEEQDALGIIVKGGVVKATDIDAIRRFALEDVRIMRREILEMIREIEERGILDQIVDKEDKAMAQRQIGRLPQFTAMICDCLEKIIYGDLDFIGEVVNKKMFDISTGRQIFFDMGIKEEGVTIKFEGKDKDEQWKLQSTVIQYNPIFLTLIWENIYANAKRSCAEKGVELEVKCYVQRIGDRILFEFTDNGNGMSTEIMEKLNAGEQATTKDADEPGEHGIGFWYCKQLAQKMGGELYVRESTIGQGTTVILEVNVAEEQTGNGLGEIQLSEAEFASMFSIIDKAVRHEVGNSKRAVSVAHMFANADYPFQHTMDKISVLSKIASSARMSRQDIEILNEQFSDQDKEDMQLEDSGKGVCAKDMKALRRIVLREVRQLREEIRILVKGVEKIPPEDAKLEPEVLDFHKRRLDRYGNMVCDCLEQLMQGDVDFKEGYVRQQLEDPEARTRDNVLEFIEHASRFRGCIFELSYESEELKTATVRHHPIFLTLILENIFANARRALWDHDPKMVDISVRQEDRKVVFELTDFGCGMLPEIVERINAGERVTTRMEQQGQEHGLGIWYCKQLAQKMDGDLYVKESKKDVGTTMALELPLIA